MKLILGNGKSVGISDSTAKEIKNMMSLDLANKFKLIPFTSSEDTRYEIYRHQIVGFELSPYDIQNGLPSSYMEEQITLGVDNELEAIHDSTNQALED